MAVIHRTTMSPTKIDLLTRWLPTQPWYAGSGGQPLSVVGGFRLDDPAGEVGVEFLVLAEHAEDRVVHYQVPLTYRGGPLDGAGEALLGTSEHGVLGTRWIYDGVHDPVLVAELLALVRGAVQAQARAESNTPDPSVTGHCGGVGRLQVLRSQVQAGGTAVGVLAAESADGTTRSLRVELVRVLAAAERPEPAPDFGYVSGVWRAPDGSELRGPLVTVTTVA